MLEGPAGTPAETRPSLPVPPERHLLVSEEQCRAPSAEVIRKEDALADLDLLEEVLSTGYAGYELVVSGPEEWEAVFESMRAELRRLEAPVSGEDFRALLTRSLRFTRDRHLAFWTVAPDGRFRFETTGRHSHAYVPVTPWTEKGGKLFLDGDEVVECEAQDLRELVRPALVDKKPGSLIVRLSETKPAPLTCRVATANGEVSRSVVWRGLRLPKPKQKADKLVSTRVERGITILRIASFNSNRHEQLMELVSVAAHLRDESTILVDLRNNPGGDATYAQKFFVNLTSATLRESVIDELMSSTTHQGTVNWATCSLADPKIDDDARQHFEQKRTDFLARLDDTPAGDRAWRVFTPVRQGRAPKLFEGRLVVLMNRHCASACEDFLMFALQLPNTVLVGENSGGAHEFGEVRYYRLPRSGIWMWAGIKWFHDPDPKMVAKEGYGYMPDLWLDTEDPLAAALDIAQCLEAEGCAEGLRSRFAALH